MVIANVRSAKRVTKPKQPKEGTLEPKKRGLHRHPSPKRHLPRVVQVVNLLRKPRVQFHKRVVKLLDPKQIKRARFPQVALPPPETVRLPHPLNLNRNRPLGTPLLQKTVYCGTYAPPRQVERPQKRTLARRRHPSTRRHPQVLLKRGPVRRQRNARRLLFKRTPQLVHKPKPALVKKPVVPVLLHKKVPHRVEKHRLKPAHNPPFLLPQLRPMKRAKRQHPVPINAKP